MVVPEDPERDVTVAGLLERLERLLHESASNSIPPMRRIDVARVDLARGAVGVVIFGADHGDSPPDHGGVAVLGHKLGHCPGGVVDHQRAPVLWVAEVAVEVSVRHDSSVRDAPAGGPDLFDRCGVVQLRGSDTNPPAASAFHHIMLAACSGRRHRNGSTSAPKVQICVRGRRLGPRTLLGADSPSLSVAVEAEAAATDRAKTGPCHSARNCTIVVPGPPNGRDAAFMFVELCATPVSGVAGLGPNYGIGGSTQSGAGGSALRATSLSCGPGSTQEA